MRVRSTMPIEAMKNGGNRLGKFKAGSCSRLIDASYPILRRRHSSGNCPSHISIAILKCFVLRMSTEDVDPRFADLDAWPTASAVEAMWDGQMSAIAAVREVLPVV